MSKCFFSFLIFLFCFSFLFGQQKNTDSITKITDKQIEEVIIKGGKKLIEKKVDRIIYKISEDDFNKGSNLLTALNRAPRLEVVNESIKIIGKISPPKIAINGRLQNLSEEEIKLKLKSLRVEQIERIEVISIPPSRYSAEGNGGILNIILKKDENEGMQGNVNSGIGIQFKKVSTDQGFNLNYKQKKIDLTTNLIHNDLKFTNDNRLFYDFQNTTTTINTLPYTQVKNNAFNTILEYKPFQKLTLGTTIDYSSNNDISTNPSTTIYYSKTTQQIDSSMVDNNKITVKTTNRFFSFFSDFLIDSLGKKISFTYNDSYIKNLSDSFINSEIYTNSYVIKQFSNNGDNQYKVNGVLLDIELPLQSSKLEMGSAFTRVKNKSGIVYFNENQIIDQTNSNQFVYEENTWAAYTSFQKEWNKKWTSKVGVRVESSSINGLSTTLQSENKMQYINLFPSLFLLYNLNENHNFTLAYSKRLDRPNFFDLNPFKYYTNAYNYFSGNPFLLPTYTNTLEFNYTYKNNFNASIYSNYITNGISYLNEVDENGVYASRPQNNFIQKKGGFLTSYQFKFFPWYSLFINAESYYTQLVSEKGVQKIEGFGGSFLIRNSINLNKLKTSKLQISYKNILSSKASFSDFTTKNQAYFTISYKQMLLKKKLIFDLFFTDVFRQNISIAEKQYNTFHFVQYNDIRNRGVYLTVSFDFGKTTIEAIERDNKNKEAIRASKTK